MATDTSGRVAIRKWLSEQHCLVWKVRLEWQPMLRRRWKMRFQIERQRRN